MTDPLDRMCAAAWDACLPHQADDWRIAVAELGDDHWEVVEHRKSIRAAVKTLLEPNEVLDAAVRQELDYPSMPGNQSMKAACLKRAMLRALLGEKS